MTPAEAYLGLGSNLGDREANLRGALRELAAEGAAIRGVSSVYLSEPVGHLEQPDFWNLAVRVRTELEPAELLAAAKRVEARLGRVASFRNAPRLIDIDLLLYEDRLLSDGALEVPHPRMLERGFVLRPLLELDPELRHPATGERLARVLERSAAELEATKPLFPGTLLLDEL